MNGEELVRKPIHPLTAEQAGMLISALVSNIAQFTSQDVSYIRDVLRSLVAADAYWSTLENQFATIRSGFKQSFEAANGESKRKHHHSPEAKQ